MYAVEGSNIHTYAVLGRKTWGKKEYIAQKLNLWIVGKKIQKEGQLPEPGQLRGVNRVQGVNKNTVAMEVDESLIMALKEGMKEGAEDEAGDHSSPSDRS